MKKMLILFVVLLTGSVTMAQNKELNGAKHEATRELNREIRVGKNEGNNDKVKEAREAKETVKEAKTAEKVRETIKEYRAGNGNKPAGGRKPF